MIGHNRDDGKLRLVCMGGPFHSKELLTSLQGTTLTFRVGEQVGFYQRDPDNNRYIHWNSK